jgi:hypothetical protein
LQLAQLLPLILPRPSRIFTFHPRRICRRGSSSFLTKLKLRGNKIGKNGASKLIQYAHWARVGYTASAPKDELPPIFVIDLSDNVIERPMDLAEDLESKKIKVRHCRSTHHARTYTFTHVTRGSHQQENKRYPVFGPHTHTYTRTLRHARILRARRSRCVRP